MRRRLNARLTRSLLRSIGVDADILSTQQQDYLKAHGQDLAQEDRFHLAERMGFTLLLDRACIIDQVIDIDRTWEEPQMHLLLRLAREAGTVTGGPRVFLDIGAYWGIYSLHAARSGLFNRVIAFEPDRFNFAHLQAQLLVNQMVRKVETAAFALSDTAADLPLEQAESIGNRGSVSVGKTAAVSDTVETRRLDEVIDLTDGLIVAKIDVEGHELRVIDGGRRSLCGNRAVLQIECLEESGSQPQLKRKLGELGYAHLETIGPDHYFTNVAEIISARPVAGAP